ncbi:MAG TPA: PH domain-containing protein, partial [Thermoanaerobaculia bacterium]|nr:PH domain-containing protein [Thermoanaerobaculia bacterium]
VPLIYLYFRYHTMQYSFDEEGISMKWGILFRREIMLTYARIQDIHLTSNVIERWLGLARIQIQTASASASAEMTIEGLHEFELVRDFLYSKMRGVRSAAGTPQSAVPHAEGGNELAAALREVAAELRAVRENLEQRPR